jgi:hypothetical protein
VTGVIKKGGVSVDPPRRDAIFEKKKLKRIYLALFMHVITLLGPEVIFPLVIRTTI